VGKRKPLHPAPGRPRVVVDWAVVDKYLQAGCNGTEVAAVLGIDNETLYRRCQDDHKVGFEVYKQAKRAHGDSLLRAKQYQVAMTGDKTMLVWLGKQRLDQRDKQEVEQQGAIEVKIVREIKDKESKK